MYYLNSRYYNPQIGRFLNSDGLLGETGDILSTNMYAYCANNPVMYTDRDGHSWKSFWNDIGGWIKSTFGVTVSKENSSLSAYFFVGEYVTGSGVTTLSDKPVNLTLGTPEEWWKFWEYSIGIDVQIGEARIGLYGGPEAGISFSKGNTAYDISLNALGRVGFKISTYSENGFYTYSKYDLNGPEIAAVVLAVIYAPQLLLPLIPALSPAM